jgi:succinate dehydrogenase / fumarate reductase flavoprotein subunit
VLLHSCYGQLSSATSVEGRRVHAGPDDYPERDDERFLKHSVTHRRDGGPELGWKPVTLTKWQPAERTH